MAKIAVIGGGAAGMMFSTQYKKMNPGDEIFIFEKTNVIKIVFVDIKNRLSLLIYKENHAFYE